MGFGSWASVVLLCASMPLAAQQGAAPPAPSQAAPDRDHPALSHRPPPPADNPEGKIKLDVLVTDEAGRPVSGLQREDFTLLDNKKLRPLISFRAVDGVLGAGQGEPPVQVILLIDVTNTSLRVVGNERYQIESFLRRNGGKLIHPTSLMVFNEQGVKGQLQPTLDGNLLADELNRAETTVHSIPLTTEFDSQRLTLSLDALQLISQVTDKKPGRTILIWIGEYWPMLDSSGYRFTRREYQGQFDWVVNTARELREERITLYSIYPIDPATTNEPHVQHYRSFLRAVPSVNQVQPGDLALPVLAIHSGGRALDVPGDLGDEIASCIAEAQSYYTLSFDPATAKHVDEYHELAVQVDKPRLKARTSTGYYAEPAFRFSLPALSMQH
jgi:VWFA-related protein